ncbi:uncharacterized protein EI90DRAFT_3017420 [Cantharellus anzutake]|uniref:uncharacterized protein n=1 Tax=Cantharellus anzutake TaxID=1750568 RepID=UPI001903817F|nr:uncharacterized protein EI90DRAFT_3017420 [Cantharellus anzutake]KAF8328791.1 hypothetical protein EI90DRAFT_3017420 [Cantharellus anzutake]
MTQTMSDLHRSPTPAFSSMGDVRENSTGITSLAEAIKVIDELQAENSSLKRMVREFEWNPRPSEEEAIETSAADIQLNDIRHFGRMYAYTVNMFMTPKECAPSKEAEDYDPSLRFGTHRKEGNFRELAGLIPREFKEDLENWNKFFVSLNIGVDQPIISSYMVLEKFSIGG